MLEVEGLRMVLEAGRHIRLVGAGEAARMLDVVAGLHTAAADIGLEMEPHMVVVVAVDTLAAAVGRGCGMEHRKVAAAVVDILDHIGPEAGNLDEEQANDPRSLGGVVALAEDILVGDIALVVAVDSLL